MLISVLHGQSSKSKQQLDEASKGGFASLVPRDDARTTEENVLAPAGDDVENSADQKENEWVANLRLLIWCFVISGVCTIATYFIPVLTNIPIFGMAIAQNWLWTLNPSLAYVGQGVIMGTETTMHMLLGAVVGWAFLSPLAKAKGWAPGPVDDWETGSKGWIVWVSLSIMLVDAVVSLSYTAFRQLCPDKTATAIQNLLVSTSERTLGRLLSRNSQGYQPVNRDDNGRHSLDSTADDDSETIQNGDDDAEDGDAPSHQLIGPKTVSIGLIASVGLCVGTTHIVFGDLVPLYATITAVLMALVLSIMGVRALGETDLNPVSGISKLAQLFFAFIIPQSNKSSVLINLVAGAVSEAGALQAGDLMQDLKTGHLLGASPKAQFHGQLIGATFGAVLSAFIYKLYTRVYEVPGKLFQVPTAYVWIFTARLVTGQGLPNMAKEWSIGAGVLFAIITLIRTLSVGKEWRAYVPGGIAVAVGMYNVPSFTLARAIGGIIAWVWVSKLKRSTTPLIILASVSYDTYLNTIKIVHSDIQ